MLLPNSSSFETLINYFSFAAWVFYGCTVSALLWLRYKKPEMKRPYKVSHHLIDSTQFSTEQLSQEETGRDSSENEANSIRKNFGSS